TVQPGPAVLIGERGARGHLGHIGLGVQVVALEHVPAQLLRQQPRHRRFTGPRHTHDDQDRRHTTTLNASTPARPHTDIRHSITVHDLRFCATDSPRNSFTNQNPASLTWDRNSEPDPIASTISQTRVLDRSAATGARIPEAVTV